MGKSKPRMTRETIPEGFTMALVLVDALPVLFFGASMVVVSILFSSRLFLLGALLSLFAGGAKVLWKVIVVRKKKNIWWLFLQMRILMPVGFLLMLCSVIRNAGAIAPGDVLGAALRFPSVLFFTVGILGMGLMIYFSAVLDSSDVRSNWIEQVTNGITQASIFVGLLLYVI